MTRIRFVSKQGFTLIEVLLATLIFSVIALSLYGTFAAGIKLNRKAEGPLKIQREAGLTLVRMTRDLGHVVFYDFSGSYPDKKSFSSDDKSLTFLISTGKGLKAVRYILRDADRGTVHKTVLGKTEKKNTRVTNSSSKSPSLVCLIREEQDFRSFLSAGFENAAFRVMSRCVVQGGMKISYPWFSPQDRELTWVEAWDKTTVPPGVRIELTLAAPYSGIKTFAKDVFIPDGGLNGQE